MAILMSDRQKQRAEGEVFLTLEPFPKMTPSRSLCDSKQDHYAIQSKIFGVLRHDEAQPLSVLIRSTSQSQSRPMSKAYFSESYSADFLMQFESPSVEIQTQIRRFSPLTPELSLSWVDSQPGRLFECDSFHIGATLEAPITQNLDGWRNSERFQSRAIAERAISNLPQSWSALKDDTMERTMIERVVPDDFICADIIMIRAEKHFDIILESAEHTNLSSIK
jgi:hypothetical protein